MAAPSIDYALTAIDIINGGANTFGAPSLESASTPTSYRDDQQGTGWSQNAGVTGLYGARLALATASSDFSVARYVWFQLAYESSNMPAFVDTLANGGIRILFVDGAGNWARFNIFGSDTYVSTTTKGGFRSFSNLGITNTSDSSPVWVIDINRTPDAESGTAIDWTDVDVLELHINIASSKLCDIFIGRLGSADRPVITAGEVANPGTIALFPVNQDNWPNDGDNPRLFSKSEATHVGANTTTYMVLYGYDIGDGTTPTYYRDTRVELAFYPSRDAQEAAGTGIEGYGAAFNGEDGAVGYNRKLLINQSATCDVEFSQFSISGVDSAGGEYVLEIMGNTAGSCIFDTGAVFRASEIICAHSIFSDVIFHDVETVSINTDSTITDCTYRNASSAATGLTITSAAGDYSAITCAIRASNSGDDLTMGSGGAGTYDLTGITVEAGHTLKIRNNSATNAITVQIDPSITASSTTAGGTVTIDNSVNYTATLKSSVYPVAYVIYDDDAADPQELGTELFRDNALAAQGSYVYPSAKAGDDIVVRVIKSGYRPSIQTVTLPAADSDILTTLTPETN